MLDALHDKSGRRFLQGDYILRFYHFFYIHDSNASPQIGKDGQNERFGGGLG